MDKNEKKLIKIADYLKKKGLTSEDEADLIAEYDELLTFEEIATICNLLVVEERKDASSNINNN